MISVSLPGPLGSAQKSKMRESFAPVQRSAIPIAPAQPPAMFSKVGHSRGLRPLPPTPKKGRRDPDVFCARDVWRGYRGAALTSPSIVTFFRRKSVARANLNTTYHFGASPERVFTKPSTMQRSRARKNMEVGSLIDPEASPEGQSGAQNESRGAPRATQCDPQRPRRVPQVPEGRPTGEGNAKKGEPRRREPRGRDPGEGKRGRRGA